MMIDQNLVFSDNLELDASDSTAWLDLGKGIEPFSIVGSGHELAAVAVVKTAAATGGTPGETYQFILEMADTNTGTNTVTVASTEVIPGAQLTAGTTLVMVPKRLDAYKRWYRFRTVIAGETPAGFISARMDYLERVQHHPATPSEVGR